MRYIVFLCHVTACNSHHKDCEMNFTKCSSFLFSTVLLGTQLRFPRNNGRKSDGKRIEYCVIHFAKEENIIKIDFSLFNEMIKFSN